ncbi:hypothetical protein [Allocoleopsis sp.]
MESANLSNASLSQVNFQSVQL